MENKLLSELENIISEESIRTLFQPIICLKSGNVLGYEALSRGPEGSPLEFPDTLFSFAKEQNKLWDLEALTRQKAIERSKLLPVSKFLFLNVDPYILNDPRFQKGMTKDILDQNNIPKAKVIFEITEKTSVKDYISFKKTIEHYRGQGYRIALDDTGAGYSGLKMVMETYPDFIKIDMELIRNINKDRFKRSLIEQFFEFAKISNIELVAEGIETHEELNTIIDIGIPFGQGYYLRKPSSIFSDIQPETKSFIKIKNKKISFYFNNTPFGMSAKHLARRDKPFEPNTIGSEVKDHFDKNPHIQGVPIVKNNKVEGLLMRNVFCSHLASRYGYSLYENRCIDLLIDKNPLIIDSESSVLKASKKAMERDDDKIYDYIIVEENKNYYGVITIKDLLNSTTEYELKNAKNCNPLTKLPGNTVINENIRNLIVKKIPFSIIYADLNNFKEYNDKYGFLQGDRILVFTAELFKNKLEELSSNNFLGHIGGDDYILVIINKSPIDLCEQIIKEFDLKIKEFYKEKDRKNGFINCKNRKGINELIPLMGVSLAVIDNRDLRYKSVDIINNELASLKRYCKSKDKSNYFVDGISKKSCFNC